VAKKFSELRDQPVIPVTHISAEDVRRVYEAHCEQPLCPVCQPLPKRLRHQAAIIGIGALSQGLESNRQALKEAHDLMREAAKALEAQ
jgi:hypothetical protein